MRESQQYNACAWMFPGKDFEMAPESTSASESDSESSIDVGDLINEDMADLTDEHVHDVSHLQSPVSCISLCSVPCKLSLFSL